MRSMSEVPKMRQYLRRARSAERRAPGALRSALRAPRSALRASLGMTIGLMAGMSLFEHAGDHLIQGRIMDAHVDHGVLIKDDAKRFGHPAALHPESDCRPFPVGDLAESFEPIRRHL